MKDINRQLILHYKLVLHLTLRKFKLQKKEKQNYSNARGLSNLQIYFIHLHFTKLHFIEFILLIYTQQLINRPR